MGTTVTTSSVGLSKVITISPLFMTFNQTRVRANHNFVVRIHCML